MISEVSQDRVQKVPQLGNSAQGLSVFCALHDMADSICVPNYLLLFLRTVTNS